MDTKIVKSIICNLKLTVKVVCRLRLHLFHFDVGFELTINVTCNRRIYPLGVQFYF